MLKKMQNTENTQKLKNQFELLVQNKLTEVKDAISSRKPRSLSKSAIDNKLYKEKVASLSLKAQCGDLNSFNELLKMDAFIVKDNGLEKRFDHLLFFNWYKSCVDYVKKSKISNDVFVKATNLLYESLQSQKMDGSNLVFYFWLFFVKEMSSSKSSPVVEGLLNLKGAKNFLKVMIVNNINRIHMFSENPVDFVFFQKKINYYDLSVSEFEKLCGNKIFLMTSLVNCHSNKLINKIKTSGLSMSLSEEMSALDYFCKNKYSPTAQDLWVNMFSKNSVSSSSSSSSGLSVMSDDDVLRSLIILPINTFNDFYSYFKKYKSSSFIKGVSTDYSNRLLSDYELVNKLYLSSENFINLIKNENLFDDGSGRYQFLNLNKMLIAQGVLDKKELVLLSHLKEPFFRKKLQKESNGPLFEVIKDIIKKLYAYDDKLLFHWFSKNDGNQRLVEKTVGLFDKSGCHYYCYKALTLFDAREASYNDSQETVSKMIVKNWKYLSEPMSGEFWSKRASVYKLYTPNLTKGQSVLDYLEACKKQLEDGGVDKNYFKRTEFETFLRELESAKLTSAIGKGKELPKKIRSL